VLAKFPTPFVLDRSSKAESPTHVFHRATAPKKKRSKSSEVAIDQPELSISEKLSKVRVQTLVKEYLALQEL